MSKYTFNHDPEIKGSAQVMVTFDDTDHPFIEDVLVAFEQFLLGVTFQPGSIDRYLNRSAIRNAQYNRVVFGKDYEHKRANLGAHIQARAEARV